MFFPKVGFSVFKNCLVSTHKGLNLLMLMEFLLASYNNYLHVSDFDLFFPYRVKIVFITSNLTGILV